MSKRRCRICRRWFQPNLRSRHQQRVCSKASCQKERHRRACAEWHRRNPGYDKETRLRLRLVREAPANQTTPMAAIDEDVARDAVGVEAYVLISETARVVTEWARDAPGRQPFGIKHESRRVGRGPARDEMASARAGP